MQVGWRVASIVAVLNDVLGVNLKINMTLILGKIAENTFKEMCKAHKCAQYNRNQQSFCKWESPFLSFVLLKRIETIIRKNS